MASGRQSSDLGTVEFGTFMIWIWHVQSAELVHLVLLHFSATKPGFIAWHCTANAHSTISQSCLVTDMFAGLAQLRVPES